MMCMRFLGIDYGARRVGIAISSEEGNMAFPKCVLPNDRYLIERIAALCEEEDITAIVLGESKNYEGVPNPIMKKILIFKKTFEETIGLPVYLHPEFLTSAEAERIQGKNELHDASAAALILKSYLESTTA
jgi:putative holliday junction resolvase